MTMQTVLCTDDATRCNDFDAVLAMPAMREADRTRITQVGLNLMLQQVIYYLLSVNKARATSRHWYIERT